MRLSMSLVLAQLFASGCAAPQKLHVERDGQAAPVIIWDATSALGLYVVSPDAQLPTGPSDHVKGGTTYWTVDATSFPGGFASPVTYGMVPAGGKDSTHDNGGGNGPASLADGVFYKFGVVSFGGTDTVEEMW